MSTTSTRSGAPTPRLEITTPAVRTPGVTVELEPSGASSGGKEIRVIVTTVLQHYRCTGMVKLHTQN